MSNLGIRFSDVTLSYDRHPAVHHLSGVFAPESLTAVVGPNGAGKSTLLKALMGEECQISGHLEFGSFKRDDFAYMPQVANLERQFPLTVADMILLGAWKRTGPFRSVTEAVANDAASALAAVGMNGFENRSVGSLSGGQMQRVLFARLLVQDARVVLLDEPFMSIDDATTRDLLQIVQKLHREGRTVIAVLHDFGQVRSYFPETLLLSRRMIAWGKTEDVMTEDNLSCAQGLSAAWHNEAQVCTESKVSR